MITTRSKKIPFNETLSSARIGCGEVWSQTVWARQWLFFEHDYNLSKGDAKKFFATGSLTKGVREAAEKLPFEVDFGDADQNPFCTEKMRLAPSQQQQETIRRLYDAYKTYFSNYANDDSHSPPGPKRFYNCRWLHYHFTHKDGVLSLSMGRGRENVKLDWPYPTPKNVDVGYENGQHVLYCVYDSEWQELPEGFLRTRKPLGEETAGIDLGEKVLAAAYDGTETILVDGSELRRLRRIQNEEKQDFAARIDRKQKGSNRWWKLVRAKKRRLGKLRDKIEDQLHKLSTRLIEELHRRGVSTIAVGNITGIRNGMDYGASMNRRLHQWAFRQFAEKLKYKAERYGMDFDMQTCEAYTSQACPQCNHRSRSNKQDRTFRCAQCGFEAHRDQIGALNIRTKYLHPKAWDGNLQAVRATANDLTKFTLSETKGSPSRRKSGRSSSDERTASALKRATQRVFYDHHMDCVVSSDCSDTPAQG